MIEKEVNKFKRGITDNKVLEKAKSFFCSPLGKNIIGESSKGINPFQICIRNNYFNVYWNGCSVMKYNPRAIKNIYTINRNYIHRGGDKKTYLSMIPDEKPQTHDLRIKTHKEWSFYEDIVKPAINGDVVPVLSNYVGKSNGKNLKEKALIKLYLESAERPFLIDLEVAFSRLNENNKPVADRIDMAEIVYNERDTPVLRLIEVKTSNDPRLKAHDKNTLEKNPKKIMHQMNLYQNFLNDEMTNIVKSYRIVASNMLELGFDKSMKGIGNRSATAILQDFAKRGTVDSKPHLLVLYSMQDRYVEDDCFQPFQKMIAQKYSPLRYVHVSKG